MSNLKACFCGIKLDKIETTKLGKDLVKKNKKGVGLEF